jgi:hypothetical protein
VTSAIKALVSEYDEKWSALDVAGVAELWERITPQPVYIGDEYAAPLVGADELDRHWARVASRLKRASVSSRLVSADELAGGLVRCILLSRWSFTGTESDTAHTGTSWITWLLIARGNTYRIFHHMEAQVYLDEGYP